MPFQIINEDILKVKADAIVNSSNEYLLATGGTDKLIHDAAGTELDETCRTIGGISLGEAVITPSYMMKNCSYIIHTAGPVYIDGESGEREILESCYQNALNLAKENSISSIAFPLISSGTYQFPKGQAMEIASKAIISFLNENDMDVYLLVYDKGVFNTEKESFAQISNLFSKRIENRKKPKVKREKEVFLDAVSSAPKGKKEKHTVDQNMMGFQTVVFCEEEASMDAGFIPDVSFGEYMCSIIDKKNLKDSEVYRKANISKSVFNDIKLNRHKPKKETLCALCFGMKLTLEESLELLDRGGYTLSKHMTFDRIIRHFLKIGFYDIFDINEVLYQYDCLLLGSKSH